MSDIKISAIIPIYNAEKYLVQCIDSAVNQTLSDIEIILVNDASTDGSLEICRRYEASDKRVKLINKKENAGLAAARNSGLNVARGEYIAFIDSDDWLELDAYEKMYAAAKMNDSDIVFCNCKENENDYCFPKYIRCGAYDREQIKSEILTRTLSGLNAKGGKSTIRWSNCLRIYKHKTLTEHGICFDDRFRRCQDLPFTYEATLAAQNYYYLGDDYLYHNRTVKTSLSRGYTKNMWTLLRPLIERLYEDTRNFKELDLTDSMHLCTFFFVIDTIANEIVDFAPGDKKDKISMVSEIINDPICVNCLEHIPTDKLNEYLKNQHKNIFDRNAEKVYDYYFKYQKKSKSRQKKRKLTAKISEIGIVKKLREK